MKKVKDCRDVRMKKGQNKIKKKGRKKRKKERRKHLFETKTKVKGEKRQSQ